MKLKSLSAIFAAVLMPSFAGAETLGTKAVLGYDAAQQLIAGCFAAQAGLDAISGVLK